MVSLCFSTTALRLSTTASTLFRAPPIQARISTTAATLFRAPPIQARLSTPAATLFRAPLIQARLSTPAATLFRSTGFLPCSRGVLFGSAAPALCGVSPSLSTIQQRMYASSNRGGSSSLPAFRVVLPPLPIASSLLSGVQFYSNGRRSKGGRRAQGGRPPKGPSKPKSKLKKAMKSAYTCYLCRCPMTFISLNALHIHQGDKHPNMPRHFFPVGRGLYKKQRRAAWRKDTSNNGVSKKHLQKGPKPKGKKKN